MDVGVLLVLLKEGKWELCVGLAVDLLSRPGIAPYDQGAAHYAACSSLSHLSRYTEALQHGHAAVAISLQVSDYDLAGKSLLELSFVQQQLGRHQEAVQTLLEFGRHLPHYSEEVSKAGSIAQVNRGVSLRSVGEYEEALREFQTAMEKAHAQGDVANREYARAQATWMAFELGQLQLAEELLAQGERYLERFPNDTPARTRHLNDLAWYARLKGEAARSLDLALEAAYYGREDLHSLAQALLNTHLAGRAMGSIGDAFKVGLLAKQLAEIAEDQVLLEKVRDSLRQLLLQHRTELESVADELTQLRRDPA